MFTCFTNLTIRQRCSSMRWAAAFTSVVDAGLHNLSATALALGLATVTLHIITNYECSVVMHSVLSVCLYVCLSCSCSNFWKLQPRNFISGAHVHLQNTKVKFICQSHWVKVNVNGSRSMSLGQGQGHWVKVKVTGSKSRSQEQKRQNLFHWNADLFLTNIIRDYQQNCQTCWDLRLTPPCNKWCFKCCSFSHLLDQLSTTCYNYDFMLFAVAKDVCSNKQIISLLLQTSLTGLLWCIFCL